MRIALHQCPALSGDIDGNLRRLARSARGAATLGADLLVLPELYLTGYALCDRLRDLALSPDAPALTAVGAIAREEGIAIALGWPERNGDDLLNVAGLWDRDGRLTTRYAKTHLYGPEERRLFRPGDRLATSTLDGTTAGLLICYDVEFPEPARQLAEAGARLLIVPTANMEPFTMAPSILIQARAAENALSVVYANYCGGEGPLTYTGLSAIVGPDGVDLARAGRTGEALLIADLPAEGSLAGLSTQLADRPNSPLRIKG